MAKVYVVMETQYDIVDAVSYGEIVKPAVLPRTIYGYTSSNLVDIARVELAGYTSDDFILLIGDPVAIGIVVSIAADITGGAVNVLRWSPKEQRYNVVTFDIHNHNKEDRITNECIADGKGIDSGRVEAVKRTFGKR